MVAERDVARELRDLLEVAGVPQADLAQRWRYDSGNLSKVLNGRIPMPDWFEKRTLQTVAEITNERSEEVLRRLLSAGAGA
jgi:hypothetical protein